MRKTGLLASVLLVLSIASSTYAMTFSDNFDDQAFTTGNWQFNPQLWEFDTLDNSSTPIDLGFRGHYNEAVYEDSYTFVDENFTMDQLYVSVQLRIQPKEIIEPGQPTPKDEGGGIFFANLTSSQAVQAKLFYSHHDGWIHGAGLGDEDGLENILTGLSFDEFYFLDFAIEPNGDLTSHLRDSSGEVISTITQNIPFSLNSGVVGITSQSDVTFDEFTATAVPVPGSVLLLATGILGLAGIRAKRSADC